MVEKDSDVVGMFLLAQAEFARRVHAVKDRWSAPTPADDWTVRQLVIHLIVEQRWATEVLSGTTAQDTDLRVTDSTGGDPAGAWDDAAAACAVAVRRPGVPDRVVDLPDGPKAGRDYLREMTVDVVIHTWDLQAALLTDEPLRDDLIDYIYSDVNRWDDETATGMFAEPVVVPAEATRQDRLIAATGRDPRWPGHTVN